MEAVQALATLRSMVDAIQQLKDAILQPVNPVELDEGEKMIAWQNNIVLPGEGCKEQALSDKE